MGILEAIGGLVSEAAGDALSGVKALWQGIKSVFGFAGSIFSLVGGAWTWMVNGIQWIGTNLLGWAAVVFNLLKWLIDHALPEAVAWVYRHTIEWALVELAKLWHKVEHAVKAAVRWAEGELHRIEHSIEADVKSIWRTLSAAWHWVEHTGQTIAHYIEHPETLAQLLWNHLTWPLLKWVAQRAVALLVHFARLAVQNLGVLGPIFEDALDKLL